MTTAAEIRELLRGNLDIESAADMRWLLHLLDREPTPMAGLEAARLTLDVLAATRARFLMLDATFSRDDSMRALLLVSWRDLRKIAEAVLRPVPQKRADPILREQESAEELAGQPSAAPVGQDNEDPHETDLEDVVSDNGRHRDYRSLDEALVLEMHELVRKENITPWAASKAVVKRAAGGPTTSEESKRRRLCRLYSHIERMNS